MGSGSTQTASWPEWGMAAKRPNLPNTRLCVPFTEGGLYQFGPPSTFTVSAALAFGDALDSSVTDPMELHKNWGRVSANRPNESWWERQVILRVYWGM